LHLAWQCSSTDVQTLEAARRKAHDAKYQTNVQFKVGDRVLIRQAGRKSKMHMPYVGPFKIEEVLERDRYRVSGRRNARRDHHEFHVSRLKLWPSGADDEEVYLSDEYYDVDRIVATKVVKGETLYRVRWVGYAATDDSWLAFADMNGACARAALDYIRSQSDSPDDADEPVQRDATTEDVATPEAVAPPAAEAPVPDDVAPPTDVAVPLDAREARLAARQARMGSAPSTVASRALRQLQ